MENSKYMSLFGCIFSSVTLMNLDTRNALNLKRTHIPSCTINCAGHPRHSWVSFSDHYLVVYSTPKILHAKILVIFF